MSDVPAVDSTLDHVFAGDGEMARRMRAFDWSQTAIGPVASWSPTLRMMVPFLLANRFPILLWWGPEYIQLYNDAYAPILGKKHPHPGLGMPVRECWSEIWHVLQPLIDAPYSGGPATWMEDLALEIDRHGFTEESHFTVAYSPVPDVTAAGGIGGVMATVHETTQQVVHERRVRMLRDLGARMLAARSAEEAGRIACDVLAENPKDTPFAAIYLIDEAAGVARLAACAGMEVGSPCARAELSLMQTDQPGSWPIADVVASGHAATIEDLATRFDDACVPRGPWSDAPTRALALPIPLPPHERPAAVLVCGVSARLALDDLYRSFFELAAGQVATAVSNAVAYESERRRAEALAEIDRAKTAFFSNVSHEFRTPLTLMLGPIEDALGEPLPARQRERLALAHRNSLRLLKLVNTLLDFSRLEAGRVDAVYERTDVAAYTEELASTFRSAIERAGLGLDVAVEPVQAPVFVDREMWEKVVLNLLSNAFKFTFEGRITVAVREDGDRVVLTVRDTGIGIPASELPHVFERFHRVRGARGRTHEGTGIGLALVQELVKLHGGGVSVASELGRGTTFTVTVPTGSAHLPEDRLGAARTLASTATGAAPYVEEALRWLPDEARELRMAAAVGDGPLSAVSTAGARVLVADDNQDMRDYLARLLAPYWQVEVVGDGVAALAAVRRAHPDLVLSDVMMPNLDGFGLLRALREDAATRTLPVVLLSARAGEEARVDGLYAGADDYLTKPFAARELIARVNVHLELARLRRAAEAALETNLRDTTALMGASRELARALEMEDVLRTLCRVSRELVQADGAAFIFREGDEVLYAEEDAIGPLWKGRRFPAHVCVSGWAIMQRQTIVVEDVYDHPDVPHDVYRSTFVRALALAPVRRAEPIGALGVYWRDPCRPTAAQLGLLETLADVGAIAVQNAQLFRESEEANRRKDEFLAMLAHELRNPLAPVLNAVEIIRAVGPREPRLQHARDIIHRQVVHMTRLIDDLLDVSRITRGRIELRRERLALTDVVEAALEASRPLIEKHSHTLTVNVGGGLEVDGDRARLVQVLTNLLANAAKFTPPRGRIAVRVAADGTNAIVAVRDSGIGIAKAAQARIFDLFAQEDTGMARTRGGLGIGLTLAQRLVAMHGGTVAVRSDGIGKGAEFVVTLPVLAPTRTTAIDAVAVPAPGGATLGDVSPATR